MFDQNPMQLDLPISYIFFYTWAFVEGMFYFAYII